MSVPLYPGGNIGVPLQGASAFPVENLDPRQYLQGLQAAQLEPSALSSAVSGLQQGMTFSDEMQNNAARRRVLEAQATGLEAEAQFAPEKIQLERERARAELLQANTQALEAEVKFQQTKQTTDLYREQLAKKKGINDAFSLARGGDIPTALNALEENFSDLAQVGFSVSAKGDKPDLVPDPAVFGGLTDLLYRAERTGDSQLYERAQKLVGRFQDIGRNAAAAASGKAFDLLPARETGESAPRSQGAQILADFGLLSEAEAGALSGQQATDVAPRGQGTPGPARPVGAAPPRKEAQQQAAPTEQEKAGVLFPEQPLAVPESIKPKVHASEEKLPWSERVLHLSKNLEKKIDERTGEIIERAQKSGLEIEYKDAARQAREELESVRFSDSQEKDFTQMRNVHNDMLAMTQRAYSASERLREWMAKSKNITPAMGKANTVDWVIEKLMAEFGGDEDSRQAINDIKREFDNIGSAELLRRIADSGFGTQLINRPEEQEMFRALSTMSTNSLDMNLQAIEMLGGKTDEGSDYLKIIQFGRKVGLEYGDAVDLANRHREANPGTNMGHINNRPFVIRNTEREGAAQFLDREYFREFNSRNKEGRIINQQPAHPSETAGRIVAEVQGGKFEPAKASDIPNRLLKANEALIRRVIWAESDGNPNAISPDGAKGLMQLMDDTGKEVHKGLELDEEYDPFDPEQNIILGTTYLNQNLKAFGGDPRLALAAYNAGPGATKRARREAFERVMNARDKAERATGDVSWKTVRNYLPKETRNYVSKIMGDDGSAAEEIKTVTPEEQPTVLAAIPNAKARETAQAVLSPEGMQILRDSTEATTFAEVAETRFGELLGAFLAPAEAQAQAPSGGEDAAPTETPEDEGGGFWESASNLIPDSAQATVLGIARSAIFGLDREAGALMRVMVHGEDWDTAFKNTDAIRETFSEQNPNMYKLGELVGIAPAIYTGGAVAKTLAAPIKAGAKIIGRESVKKTAETGAASLIKQGVASGAGFGALQGAGERVEGGGGSKKAVIGGAVVGAGVGGILGGATGAALSTKPVQGLISKVANWFSGAKPETIKFNDAEAFVFKQLKDLPDEHLIALYDNLKASNNPAYRLIDELGGATKLRDYLDMVSKDPALGNELRLAMEGRIGGFQKGKATGGYGEQQGRIVDELNKHTDPIGTTESYYQAANAVAGHAKSMRASRGGAADIRYDQTRQALPKVPAGQEFIQKGTEKEASKGPKLFGPGGEKLAISEQAAKNSKAAQKVQRAIDRGDIPAEMPVFESEAVKNAMESNVVQDAIKAARGKIKNSEYFPDNSFQILHEARGIAGGWAKDGSRYPQKEATVAFENLTKAMNSEGQGGKLYEQATKGFRESSEKIKAFETKGNRQLAQFADDLATKDIEKFGENLFKRDAKTIETLYKSLSAEGQKALRNAARGYILQQTARKGAARSAYEPAKQFKNFMTEDFQNKLKAVLGDDATKSIMGSLGKEVEITAASNKVLSMGSPTQPRQKQSRFIENVADAALAIKTWGKFGIPRAVRDIFRAGGERAVSKEELVKATTEILATNPKKGLEFAAALKKNIKNKDAAAEWQKMIDKISSQATKRASQVEAQKSSERSGHFRPVEIRISAGGKKS